MGTYKNFMHANNVLHLQNTLIPRVQELSTRRKSLKVGINYLQETLFHMESDSKHCVHINTTIDILRQELNHVDNLIYECQNEIYKTKSLVKLAQRNYDINKWPKVGDVVNAPGNNGKTIIAKVYDVNSLSMSNEIDMVTISYEYEVVETKGFFKKTNVTKNYHGQMSLKTYYKYN